MNDDWERPVERAMNEPTGKHQPLEERVVSLLRGVLSLPGSLRLDRDTPLLGAIPALDSVAVVALLTELEESFGFIIADEELSAAAFTTVGSLCDWVQRQLPEVTP